MKRYLLSLLVVWLSFIWFSNWQFLDDLVINCNKTSPCSNTSIIQLWDDKSYSITPPGLVDWNPCNIGATLYMSDWTQKGVYFNYMFNFNSYPDVTAISFSRWYSSKLDCSITIKAVTNKMPVSALTPAIDWLKGTVFEIIPYVVFIWIWMLLATIWFYAVRRLVNWLAWKINSNFKSKR